MRKINNIIKDNYYQKECISILFIWNAVLTILTIISIGISIGTIIAFNDALQTEKTYEEYKKLWKQINELYAKSEDFDSVDAKIQVWNEIDDIVDTNITSFIAVTDKDKVMDLLHTIKDKTEKLDKSIMREQITGLQDNIDKTIEKAQSVKEENKDDL